MLRNVFIASLFFIMIFSVMQTPAQTGKPQYIIRTERADTVLGYMTIELFPEIAPLHSAYFDSLVNISFYDSTAFHRVAPDFVIQGGDPNSINGPQETWGEGDSLQSTIPAEFSGVSHSRGIIGAARDEDINSANSQFYINIVDNKFLDWNYTAYGQVLEGMEVADLIVSAPHDIATEIPFEKIEMFITKGETTNEIPDTPVLTSPAHGEGGLMDRDSLKWDPVGGAVMYTVQISNSSEFGSLIADEQAGTNSYTLTELELGNVPLYWRVKAHNGGNVSEFSATGNFFTSINATELISPELNDTVSITPEFNWQPVEGATAYRLEISRSPNFQANRIVYDVDTITSTMHVTTTALEANSSHYWRVYSMTDEYQGPVSGFRRFVTEEVTSVDSESQLPEEYVLYQNYPNPFNPTTVISFELPEDSHVRLSIYNILGQHKIQLSDEVLKAGYYNKTWNASEMSAGVYLYEIQIESMESGRNYSSVKKMLLLK
jgi:peptidyl-prolyl cis-trans isomerase B (cyclophilin B)